MDKMMKIWRSIFILLTSIMIAGSYPISANAAEGIKESNRKIIYIVYDNSGSTYKYSGEWRSYWAEINYGVQAFYTMTSKEDKIHFYRTSIDDSENSEGYSEFESRGYSGDTEAQETLDKIKEIKIVDVGNSFTDAKSIEQAIKGLNNEDEKDAEKWLVIFTDGKFESAQNKEYSDEKFAEILASFLENKSNIQVCYIPISDEACNDNLKDIANIFQPSGSGDIAKQLLEVCNHIYGRRNIKNVEELGYSPVVLKDNSLTISFDIPVSKCILYAYCEGLVSGELSGDILWQECIQAPQTLNLIGSGETPNEIKGIEKTGFIAELKVNPAQNESVYTVSFPGNIADMQYEIYYEPAFTVIPQVQQEEKSIIEGKDIAGDCVVSLAYANEQTGELINENANFLAVESFEVSVAGNGNNQELSEAHENNRWEGTVQPGTAVISASTVGISGETSVEFGKDYARAELIATLDDVYLMDKLDEGKQYIRLEAVLDGENITDEIEKLRGQDENFYMSFSLNKNGKNCKSIIFETEYDAVARCWKIYPQYKDEIDYSISGEYDFHASIKLNTDYYRNAVNLETNGKFYTGVSDGDIIVYIENPWECSVGGWLFPKADTARIYFEWNGRKLPSKVIEELNAYGAEELQPDVVYTIKEKSKDELVIKGRKWWNLFWLEDGTDSLTLEGSVIIFGVQKEIYDDNITINIYGLSVWHRIWFSLLWFLLVLGLIILIWKIIAHNKGVKEGSRFKLGTQVWRSYENGRNRVRATIRSRARKDLRLGRYIEYKILLYLPEEFGLGKDRLQIKVKREQNTLKILELHQPPKCDEIFLAGNLYTGGSGELRLEQQIQLRSGKSKIIIKFENI